MTRIPPSLPVQLQTRNYPLKTPSPQLPTTGVDSPALRESTGCRPRRQPSHSRSPTQHWERSESFASWPWFYRCLTLQVQPEVSMSQKLAVMLPPTFRPTRPPKTGTTPRPNTLPAICRYCSHPATAVSGGKPKQAVPAQLIWRQRITCTMKAPTKNTHPSSFTAPPKRVTGSTLHGPSTMRLRESPTTTRTQTPETAGSRRQTECSKTSGGSNRSQAHRLKAEAPETQSHTAQQPECMPIATCPFIQPIPRHRCSGLPDTRHGPPPRR